jgi:hypothetical protein
MRDLDYPQVNPPVKSMIAVWSKGFQEMAL